MKNITVSILMLLVSVSASAQMQIFQKITEEKPSSINFNVYKSQSVDSTKFKVFYFALVEKNWAEAQVGIAYCPATWLELGVGVGIEQAPKLYRYTASVWAGKNDVDFSFVGEKGHGADNWWYKTFVRYHFKKVNVGLMSWRYAVTGPFAEYQLNKDLKIWVNPGRDLEFGINRIIVGLDVAL